MYKFIKLDPLWIWFPKTPGCWPGVMWKVLEDEKRETFPFATMWAKPAIENGMPLDEVLREIGSHIYFILRTAQIHIELN